MADRFATLAGYDAGSNYDSTVEQSLAAAAKEDLPGLETVASIKIDLPTFKPLNSTFTKSKRPIAATERARRLTSGPIDLGTVRSRTPPPPHDTSGTTSNKENARREEPPPTQRKMEKRRHYGVRIADDETFEELEDSLHRGNQQDELQRMQPDISQGGDSLIAASPGNDSGQWGARAMRRRSAAGVSMKSAQEKINSLTQERDELKIVVDLLREKVSLDDRLAELIVLKKEKLSYTNKMIAQQMMLKQQDRAIKVLQKEQQQWNGANPADYEKRLAELQMKLLAANNKAEEERRERVRLEDELDFIKRRGAPPGDASRGDETSASSLGDSTRLRQRIDALRDEHEDEKYELRRERDEVQKQLEQARDEIEHLRSQQRRSSSPGETSHYHHNIDQLEQQLTAHKTQNAKMLERQAQLVADIEQHKDELYELHSSEEALQRELDVANQRLEHANITQEDEAARFVEAERLAADRYQDQIDKLRDKLASAQLQIDGKESELEKLDAELQDLTAKVADLEYELRQAEQLLEEQKGQLESVEAEADQLDRQVQAFKHEADELRVEADELQKELEAKDADLAETNKEMQEMSNRMFGLEEELEARADEIKQLDEEIAKVEEALQHANEKNDRHTAILKEKLTATMQELSETQAQLEATLGELEGMRDEADTYAREVEHLAAERARLEDLNAKLDAKVSDVVEDLKAEERALDDAHAEWGRKLEETEERMSRMAREKDEAIDALEKELNTMEDDLATRKADVQTLQDALRAKENESFRMGQSSANDRYSLELEIDRLKRDLSRCEDDLARARKEVDRKDDALRQKEDTLIQLHSELRDAQAKLASEVQAHLGLSERFEAQQNTIKAERRELEAARAKLEELEHELNDGERATLRTEQATRDALNQRNTLLLTIYQQMGKLLASADGTGTPRKRESELKPFTNFEMFHSSLLGRLRRVFDTQLGIDQKAKELEVKLLEKYNALKRQQDTRFRQIDRFETSIKAAADKQAQWRQRLVSKQAELDAVKATNAELLSQISSLKTRTTLSTPGDNNKLTALTARANTAERRLATALTQAIQAEDRLSEAKVKYGEGEGKWAARIKELELRCKAAEERVKRERQGAKERVAELEEIRRKLEKELDAATKRNRMVGDLQANVRNIH
ncbi:related to Myosin heavy chain [Melanopsichium pennsylvanicum]|uniref:Related to Myosin heavy chain n=2 Tax=Melanopsichium pennsylvanicum TaxID=63383 RepID=A0AAJ5C535_9BASI|nr:related to Myosin heavy chain [Melanopsichium pennsylvanicum 4]SNX84315.1 related to Myosin heavy chain [Melanopsichium pennsylvanicum]